jgi:hypothetical protein
MPIPPLDDATGYLPAGDHQATWTELVERFGGTYGRRQILQGLRFVLDQLRNRGVTHAWIDGSFVTDKPRPRDVDVLYDPPVDADVTTWGVMAPQRKKELKELQRVDLWPHPSPQPPATGFGPPITLHDMWAIDRDGHLKGMIIMNLDEGESG